MTINILAFGISKDIIGKQCLKINNDRLSTVSQLKKYLKLNYPGLNTLPDFLIAVNSKYVRSSFKLHSGDEIAIIPPTNGG